MKIKRLSLFLALVMILSAFAGTFTISAEGEVATKPWKVGETTYATLKEAVEAAADGATIYVTEDATVTASTTITSKTLTIEGVANAEGKYPTIKASAGMLQVGGNNASDAGAAIVKNLDYVFEGNQGYYDAFFVTSLSSLTLENMNIVSKDNKQVVEAFIRMRSNNGDGTLVLKNTKIAMEGNTPHIIFFENGKSNLTLENTTLTSLSEAFCYPANGTVTYVGENHINGSLNNEVELDKAAAEQEYLFRVTDATTATANEEYYADFAEAYAAAKAGSGVIYLIADYTLEDSFALDANLTIAAPLGATATLTVADGKAITHTGDTAVTLTLQGVNVKGQVTLAATDKIVLEGAGFTMQGGPAATGATVEYKGVNLINGELQGSPSAEYAKFHRIALVLDGELVIHAHFQSAVDYQGTATGATYYLLADVGPGVTGGTKTIIHDATVIGKGGSLLLNKGNGYVDVTGTVTFRDLTIQTVNVYQYYLLGIENNANATVLLERVDFQIDHKAYGGNGFCSIFRLRDETLPMSVTLKDSKITISATAGQTATEANHAVFNVAKKKSSGTITLDNTTIDLSQAQKELHLFMEMGGGPLNEMNQLTVNYKNGTTVLLNDLSKVYRYDDKAPAGYGYIVNDDGTNTLPEVETETETETEPEPTTGSIQVGDKYFEDLQDAIDAAGANGTVEILADILVTGGIEIANNLTIVGVANAEGKTPVFTFNPAAGGNAFAVIGVGVKGDASVVAHLTIENVDIVLDTTRGTGAFTLYQGADLTLNNVNMLATNNVHGANKALIRVYDSASVIELLNTNITVDETFKPGTGASAVVLFDKTGTGNTFIVENTNIDATASPIQISIATATADGNAMIVKNSVLLGTPGSDAFIAPENASIAITLQGINNVNDVITNEDGTIIVAKIGDKLYGSVAEAIADAKEGDVIYILADTTIAPDTMIKANVTIEGVKKSDGKLPVLTFNPVAAGSSFAVIGIGTKGEIKADVVFKNIDMVLDSTRGTGAFTVYMGSNLTLDNVNILATNNVHGANTCLIRVYDANSTVTILNSNVTVDETFKPGTGASTLVLFDKEKTGGALVIENTIVDASKAPVTFPIAKATAAGNTVTVKNSVLTASAETDAFIGFAEGEVAYKGVNLVNGELIVDVEGIRAEAIELGYAFEIGEVADAYDLGKFTGYYKTLADAVAAAKAGDVILLLTDVSVELETMISVDVTIEGLKNAEGKLPVLTFNPAAGGNAFGVIGIGAKGETKANVVIKNIDMVLDSTKGTGAITVYMGSNLTLENVNILATNNVHGANTSLIRVYDANSTVKFIGCDVTVDETFKPGYGASTLVLFDKAKTGGTLVIEDTTVDASKAPVTFPIAKATAAGNKVVVINSSLTPAAGSPLFEGFDLSADVTADVLLTSKTTNGNVDTYTVILPNGLGSFTFTVTNGVDGQPGEKGDKGDTGDKGDKGDTGDKGDKGDTGEKGDKGDNGADGADGANGADGKDGVDGKDGATGPQGPAGADGKDGEDAASGLATVAIAVAAIAIVCNIVLAVAVVKKKKD